MSPRGTTGPLAGLSFLCLWRAARASDLPATQMDAAPLNYLRSYGTRADWTVPLTWGLIGISVAVVVIVTALVVAAIWRNRATGELLEIREAQVRRGPSGIQWIAIGVGISTVVLLGATVWNLIVLRAIGPSPKQAAATVEITGHQWWWEIRYLDGPPSQQLVTANELHIPVGQPVLVKLKTADVIHSFWVPALAGKTDLIPGQTNESWIQANKAGTYRGQCGEFCGWQHAHMAFIVVAEAPDDYRTWRTHQLQGVDRPADAALVEGEAHFIQRCGACHTVRGTPAQGRLGPDLTHLMTRKTLAAGTLANTPGTLAGWMADPQRIKPGCRMPTLALSGPEMTGIRRYVETLH